MPSWGPDLVNKLILFYSILYVLKTSHCGWNPEQNSTQNSPRIINVREIDRNYLILTINKRLFTMKVENHDTHGW